MLDLLHGTVFHTIFIKLLTLVFSSAASKLNYFVEHTSLVLVSAPGRSVNSAIRWLIIKYLLYLYCTFDRSSWRRFSGRNHSSIRSVRSAIPKSERTGRRLPSTGRFRLPNHMMTSQKGKSLLTNTPGYSLCLSHRSQTVTCNATCIFNTVNVFFKFQFK